MNLIHRHVKSAFSWARSTAIASALALHLAALLLILAPGSPTLAKEAPKSAPIDVSIVVPPPTQKPPPPPPEPPQFVVRKQPPKPVSANPVTATVPVVVAESAVSSLPVTPPLPQPSSADPGDDQAPSANIAYAAHAKPRYPVQAIRQRHEGQVVLLVLVGTDGLPKAIKLGQSSGYRELDHSAIQTAWKWRFHPGRHQGKLVEAWARVPIAFTLDSVL